MRAARRKIYASRTRFFVPFISAEYLAKPVPRDEFSSAMAAAVNKGGDYILPAVFGDIEIPPELLNPHIHYLRAEYHTPGQLADQLEAKVNEAKISSSLRRPLMRSQGLSS